MTRFLLQKNNIKIFGRKPAGYQTSRPKERSSKMKINKETQALNDTVNKMNLIDIYRTFHPKTTECTFFSTAHGTFSRIDHILSHKSSLGKFKKIEIVSSIFSDHNAMRLNINYRKISVKYTNTRRLNNTILNNQEISEEIKEEEQSTVQTPWPPGWPSSTGPVQSSANPKTLTEIHSHPQCSLAPKILEKRTQSFASQITLSPNLVRRLQCA